MIQIWDRQCGRVKAPREHNFDTEICTYRNTAVKLFNTYNGIVNQRPHLTNSDNVYDSHETVNKQLLTADISWVSAAGQFGHLRFLFVARCFLQSDGRRLIYR